MMTAPQLIFVAGPSGAGKSTFSKDLSPAGTFIFDPDKEKATIAFRFAILPQESIDMHSSNIFRIASNWRSGVSETL